MPRRCFFVQPHVANPYSSSISSTLGHWYSLLFSQGELLSGVLGALSCLQPLITAKVFLNTEFWKEWLVFLPEGTGASYANYSPPLASNSAYQEKGQTWKVTQPLKCGSDWKQVFTSSVLSQNTAKMMIFLKKNSPAKIRRWGEETTAIKLGYQKVDSKAVTEREKYRSYTQVRN